MAFLDGLRGLAAIVVVAYHLGGRTGMALVPHGYIAVDFFFVLSGFVIAYAYEDRLLNAMPLARFAAVRLIRLLPLLALGTAIGAVAEFWRPGVADHIAHYRDIAMALAAGSFAIPILVPLSLEHVIFPINGPGWSLFFELFVNIVFAGAIVKLRRNTPVVVLTLFCLASLAAISLSTNSIDKGYGLADWLGGFPRAGYSFFAGVIIYRCRDRFRAVAPPLMAGAILLLLAMPVLPAPWNGVFDLAVVCALFPIVVGVSSAIQVPRQWLGICALAGALSYPLYALHYPIVRVAALLLDRLAQPVRLVAALGLLAGLVGAAWLADRFFDQPVRRALTSLLQSRTPTPVRV